MILRNYTPGYAIRKNGVFIKYGSLEVVSWTAKGQKVERRRVYLENTVWRFADTDKEIPSKKLHNLDIALPF